MNAILLIPTDAIFIKKNIKKRSLGTKYVYTGGNNDARINRVLRALGARDVIISRPVKRSN